jgi:Protein of unknown function (DUF1573)
MIKWILVIALTIYAPVLIFGQTNQESASGASAPKIVFNKTSHDFGELNLYSPAFCEFKFYNKGRAPLILSDITAACGCTVPSWPKKPIIHGDSGIIVINYLPDETGTIDKNITVFSNATKIPVTLELKGKVIKK